MAATHLITVRPVDQVVRLGNAPRRHFLDQVIFQTPGCFRLVRLFDDGLYSLSTRKRHRSHHDTRRFTSAEAHKFCLLNISHHVWPWALWVSGVTSSDVTHTHFPMWQWTGGMYICICSCQDRTEGLFVCRMFRLTRVDTDCLEETFSPWKTSKHGSLVTVAMPQKKYRLLCKN